MKKRSMKLSMKLHELLPSCVSMTRQNVMSLRLLIIAGHQLTSGKCKLVLDFISVLSHSPMLEHDLVIGHVSVSVHHTLVMCQNLEPRIMWFSLTGSLETSFLGRTFIP